MSNKQMMTDEEIERISYEITSKVFDRFMNMVKKSTQQQMLEMKIAPDAFMAIICQSAVNFFVSAMKMNDKMLKDIYGVDVKTPTLLTMCDLMIEKSKTIKHFNVN